MKTALLRPFRPTLVAACLVLAALASHAAAGPAVTARQALDLAEAALAAKNAGDTVYVQSLVLQRTSVISGKSVWSVSWSEGVPGSKPDSTEVGVEIGMDGSVVHLVKGRGAPRKPQPAPR